MPANNGLTLAAKNCDVEIENAAGDIYGFPSFLSTIPEDRASQLTASTGEAAPTFKSAEPFEAVEWSDFSYGYGQVNGDREEGGVAGMGGNPAQYFYGDCFSLFPSKLLPGMARDQVYNTIAGSKTPISDNLNPLGGDEMEVPRGVVPGSSTPGALSFVAASTVTVTSVRLLIYTRHTNVVSVQAQATISSGGGGGGAYNSLLDLSSGNATGWKWVTLPKISGTGAIVSGTSYTLNATLDLDDYAVIGCYISGAGNNIYPYFQLMTSATPFKYWAAPPARFEQVNNAGAYVNAAITTGAMFNTDATATAGTAGTSPERSLGGTLAGSVVFNKNLYIGTTAPIQVLMWTPAQAATNAAAGSTTTAMSLVSAFAYNGLLYALNNYAAGVQNIYKWTGVMPVTVGTIAGGQNLEVIILNGKIGDPGTLITSICMFQGVLYLFKPEGLFKIVDTVDNISTAKVPQTILVWAPPGGVQLDSTGKWFVEHAGKLYFNYKNLVVELVMQEDKPTITYYNPSPPWYRLSYYSYINGLASDGQNLYCSLNNFGISAFNGKGWHMISEFYEQVAVEGQSSGLKWLPNPTGAPDYLFCGDGRTLLKIPIPNTGQPFTSQIYQNHQNKCGYWISPEWTGNLGDIEKNLRSVILRATPNGWSYKLVAVVWQTGTTASFASLLVKTWFTGLIRDSWVSPYISFSSLRPKFVATQQLQSLTGPTRADVIANTLAPACWASTDFDNASYQSKKLCVATTNTLSTPPATENITKPVKVAKTQFILYFWNPAAGQASTTGTEVMSVDTIAVKHLPKLKYVARYRLALNLAGLASIGTAIKSAATVHAEAAWLRTQWVKGDPLYFRFYDMTGTIKQVEGIIQGNHADVFPVAKGDTKIFPFRADFNVLSINEEE
jgi:hypothetical protein